MKRGWWLALLGLALVLIAPAAPAAPRDAAAKRKIDEAINVHYLATDFRKAEGVLLGTVRACGTECSPGVIATAWMYVGVVRGARGSADSARLAFEEAFNTDPGVQLDAALATPEVQQIWDDVAASFGGGGGAGASEEITDAEVTDDTGFTDFGGSSGGGSGTMRCTPEISEIETRRPIPVSCDTDVKADRAEIYYRAFGSSDWEVVGMGRSGKTWVGSIPCSATELKGKLEWYVEAKAEGRVVDQQGGARQPNKIRVVDSTTEEPPAFPGQKAPERCKQVAECPPEMIGTPACEGVSRATASAAGKRAWGEKCEKTTECDAGLACISGTCDSPPACDTDSECQSGRCVDFVCAVESEEEEEEEETSGSGGKGPVPLNRIGLSFAFDLVNASGVSVCNPDSPDAPLFDCFEGGPYPPQGREVFSSGDVAGTRTGTARIMASYERLIYGPVGLEGLVGIAFGGSPDAFQVLHLEGRINYWFGNLADSGIRGVIHAGGGRGEFDSVTDIQVFDFPVGTPPAQIPGATQEGAPVAYGRYGTTFVGGGGGVMVAFSRQFGVHADLQVLATFPASAIVIQPSFGASYGF